MDLTQEHKLIQDMVRKFAVNEIEPIAAEIDKNDKFPIDIIKKMAELGILGIIIPEKYGGANLDFVSYCIIIEEISKVLASIGAIIITNNALVSYPIIKYGNEEQKSILPKLSSGEIIGAFVIGDEIKIKDEHILSGEKHFVVNAEVAKIFIVFSDNKGFIVDRDKIKIEKEDIMGFRGAGICKIILNEVKAENIIKCDLNDIISFANLGIAAQSLGIAETAFAQALKYSKERVQFDRPICKFEMVQEMLVDMAIKISASQSLIYDTAKNWSPTQAKIAKVFSTDSAMFAGIKGIQVFGGYGYTKDYPMERYFRDAKTAQVWINSSIESKINIAKEIIGDVG